MTPQAHLIEAIRLYREIREREALLEPLKEYIRDAASRERAKTDEDRVEYDTPDGVVTVTFPKDRLVVRKGADPTELRKTLPKGTFGALFAVKLCFADGASDAFDALKGAARTAVRKVLAFEPATARVELPK